MSRGFSSSFSSLLLLLLSVAATTGATPLVQVRDNLVRLPFAKHLNLTGTGTLIARDQARVKGLIANANAKINGVPLSPNDVISVPTDNKVVQYVVDVGVGSPLTTFSLIVDTGSSNTWVNARGGFVQTSTTRTTPDRVAVQYGSGDVSGVEFTDSINIAPGLTVVGQSIGVATHSDGFQGVDGILGIGPTDLTLGTLSPDFRNTIPTVTDNLFAQGAITSNEVSVSFAPTNQLDVLNGELTFGGTDPDKFTGSITFAPLTRTQPASEFWGINQAIRLGSNTGILSTTAGIIDTGTTLTLIATDAFDRYARAIGAEFDDNTGLLRITPAEFSRLPSLFFTINGVDFEFTPNAQIFPRALNTAIGGSPNAIYLIIGDIGSPSGEGLDFINGQTWLERFYAVFDTTNRRVGFANTPLTHATTN